MEDLSDASFLGKLLVLPANVRLDWKVFAGANTLAYLASSSATKKKSFMALTPVLRRLQGHVQDWLKAGRSEESPGASLIKHFTAVSYDFS